MIYLSYIIDEETPTYGNRNKVNIEKKSSILKGGVANDSTISTTLHIGTHVDMPYHFYENGQTIKDFPAEFWVFKKPLIIEIEQKDLIVNDLLIEKLENVTDKNHDVLIVKTGVCNIRSKKEFWDCNYGFHPDIYDYITCNFPLIRLFGFDSISVSSIQNRLLGREAHKRFLNPKNPILLLEDMDLRLVTEKTQFNEIIVAPLRVALGDGLPCSVFGRFND